MKRFWFKLKLWVQTNVLGRFYSGPQVIDWIVQVQTTQPYGQFDMLITDTGNRAYNLGVGALLVGKNPVPRGKWKEVFGGITEGTTLKVRIRANELAEATGLNTYKSHDDTENLQIRARNDVQGSGGINILRVNEIR